MILNRRLVFQRVRAAMTMAFFAGLAAYAAWPWVSRRPSARTVVFYGFSILGETMNQRIFPFFQQQWRSDTREEIEFISSFAGSGTVTSQINMGVPAELALLSLELDAQRIADAGVIESKSWRKLPHSGVVNRTPFIILVRPGNPKGIRDFADLARPNVSVVHPDPLTSGGANWSIVAEYGAGTRGAGGDAEAGHRLLLGIWRNVRYKASSARAARTQFENGFGDALVTYEQEALWDRMRGRLNADIVYPRSTILSEHTLVIIERNIVRHDRELVHAFAEFLWSEAAQRRFVECGFRSLDEKLNAGFDKIDDPFLIDDFGGWERAKREIIDGEWKGRVLKELTP
jgi:sulfate transport system substrate-binding protein